MENKTVSVVICNGRPEFPSPTIESVIHAFSRVPGIGLEIVVISNGGRRAEKTPEWPACKYVEVANKSACYKRNLGAKEAVGEYLYFLDDDVVMHEDAAIGIAFGLRNQIDVATSMVFVEGARPIVGEMNENGLLSRRSIFLNTLFDEHLGPGSLFASSEARDLSLRLAMLNVPVGELDAKIFHPSLDREIDGKKVLTYAMGNGYVHRKHKKYRHLLVDIAKQVAKLIAPRPVYMTRRLQFVRLMGLILGFLLYEDNMD